MSRLRRLRDERGLTLVELVVVMLVMGIVFGSISLVLARSNNAEKGLNLRFQDQTTARVALDRLRNDVRCAQAVSGGGTAVTLTLPATCSGGGTVSWCVLLVSGSRYALYRQVGASCTSSGTRWADYVAQTSPTQNLFFTITAQSPTSLARVAVDLPVSRRLQPHDAYELTDSIVLRNSIRS